jgi:DNA-binding transcriptional MerR regulator
MSGVQTFRIDMAAKILGIHPNTIRRYCDEGIMQCIQAAPGAQRRFTLAHLEAFIQRQLDIREADGRARAA